MTTAQDQVTDSLNRAQKCWDLAIGATPNLGDDSTRADEARFATNGLITHVTTVVLLEHLRRADPDTADRITPWLFSVDGGIFADGYAGELLYGWRQPLAAGQPLHPIGPDEERTA